MYIEFGVFCRAAIEGIVHSMLRFLRLWQYHQCTFPQEEK